MSKTKPTVGEALVSGLKQRGVDCVFGIPGVHTIEHYRGLDLDGIRHVTPRHEQGAGFMADGYARASGKPGVAFVITGPGLTNTITPVAQSRADSVPVLVVSGVNARASLGQGMGHLHELPDQQGLMQTVVATSEHVNDPNALNRALTRAFDAMQAARPTPAHIEVPLDVAGVTAAPLAPPAPPADPKAAAVDALQQVVTQLTQAERVVILAGGGIKTGGAALQSLAESLDAPVVQTTNARGLMHQHPLTVPASPSLKPVRDLIEEADCVLALGTELGPTDYDMYATGDMAQMRGLIRVDICPNQIARHPHVIALCADAATVAGQLAAVLPSRAETDGAARAEACRTAAWDALSPAYRANVAMLNAMRDALPGAQIVGDSTQPIYAGNLYYDHDVAGGWFNSSTGYGALGYAIPAAIGAAIAKPDQPTICLTGDGGAQFSLSELAVAAQEGLPVRFVIWNNHGFGEIAAAMRDVDAPVIGCDPTPPRFAETATSYGMVYRQVPDQPDALIAALRDTAQAPGPVMIEVVIAS